ncbi:MAG: cytochrome c oxidase assembly protein [Tabrizicola sp.]|uniref:cytochrome c oxidase assembly protein n=1 Tax=Tabrizicola sp. TaxID=2005166 RepID=UPI002ABA5A23|nr:cytochrome c oxidase assembly protein [Tabrizicola sp.]MDZ4086580.1 cytochrome c oxidase assembly protein [Tabrizicola sp.]
MIFPRLQGNNRTLAMLASLVVGLTFTTIVIIPPFYDWFCRVTGFGGTTAVAETGADTILDQTVKVRFDASLEQGMPWTFKPVERSMDIRIGETGLAFYEAHNPTDRPVAGTATFNVYPYAAGGFFTKIECFCFTEQVLQPGETVQMPVSFYVDPAMVEDIEGQFVHEIVLSYTFHETPLPEEQAALDTPAADTEAAVN